MLGPQVGLPQAAAGIVARVAPPGRGVPATLGLAILWLAALFLGYRAFCLLHDPVLQVILPPAESSGLRSADAAQATFFRRTVRCALFKPRL